MSADRVIVARIPAGGFEVISADGTATSGQLTLGEMLEQVMNCLATESRTPYPMRTPDEWRQHLNHTRLETFTTLPATTNEGTPDE